MSTSNPRPAIFTESPSADHAADWIIPPKRPWTSPTADRRRWRASSWVVPCFRVKVRSFMGREFRVLSSEFRGWSLPRIVGVERGKDVPLAADGAPLGRRRASAGHAGGLAVAAEASAVVMGGKSGARPGAERVAQREGQLVAAELTI